MSDIARRQRSARQIWAAPGSSHDRLIRLLGFGLPIAIGVLAAFLVMAPLTASGDVSFVLDKNKVEVAKERMKLQAATYRGQDTKGQAFTLNAGSAVQQSSAVPIVQIDRLAADLQLEDGPATVRADTARYDMDTQQAKVDGPVTVRTADGYRLDTSDATLDLRNKKLTGTGAVKGNGSQGAFSARTMTADLDSRTVALSGNARLRIVPGATR